MKNETQKVKCIDIELAIMSEFDYRRNLIVTNVSNQMNVVAFETDVLVLTNSGYAYGFEIKISKSDLRADFKKPQHTGLNIIRNGKTGLERYYGKLKHFSYAVPEELKELALELIPDFCGLWLYRKNEYPHVSYFYCARKPKKLFDYKWSFDQRYELARLGTMRIYSLKSSLIFHKN